MEIKGPAGTPPVEREPVSVKPGQAGAQANSSGPSSPSVTVQLTPSLFKTGQLLNVVVAKIEQDALLLLLQNKLIDHRGEPLTVQFRTPRIADVRPGQQLTVEVSRVKDNVPELTLVSLNRQTTALATQLQHTAQQQRPVNVLFDLLTTLHRHGIDKLPLSNDVRQQLERLWRAIPDALQLPKGDVIQQAIRYSGPFLEANLLKAAMGKDRVLPAMDIRTQLLKLAEGLRQAATQPQPPTGTNPPPAASGPRQPLTTPPLAEQPPTRAADTTITRNHSTPTGQTSAPAPVDPRHPTPPQHHPVSLLETLKSDQLLQQLLQATEGSLARMQHQQLHMAQGENRLSWIFELPVKYEDGSDVFDVRIHRDPQQQDNPETEQHYPWTVSLAFNLDGLGPVRTQISFYKGEISTYWLAEQQQTVNLFYQYRDILANRLRHKGVSVEKLACRCGTVPNQVQVTMPTYSPLSLDEQV